MSDADPPHPDPTVGPPPPPAPDADDEPRPRRRRPNRVVAWIRGWSSEHASREKLVGGLQTMLWVAPLTVLIWIYAERQQQVLLKGVTLPIRVVSGDPSKIVRPIGDSNVIATLIGPPSEVDRDKIKSKFDPSNGNAPIEILLDRTTGLGRQPIQAIRIRDDRRLTDAGITVDTVSPVELQVVVDQIVTRLIEVEPKNGQPLAAASAPVFDPAKVEVTGPERVLADQTAKIRVVADVAAALAKRPPAGRGEKMTLEVPVELEGVSDEEQKYVKISRPRVVAQVVPVEVEERELPRVRLWLSVPKPLQNGYVVDFNDTMTNVKVTGQKAAIDKLVSSPEGDPVVYVIIPQSVVTNGEGDANLDTRLPDGIVWTDPTKTVRVTVRPK